MKYSFKINKFDGGLNTKISSLQGEPNESPDCQNVEFDDVGAVGTRLGTTKINTAPVAGAVDLLHTYRSNSGSELLAAYGSIFKLSGTSFGEVTGSTGLFTAGVRVHAENAQNYVFFGNGTAEYKYNGADFTRWGVPTLTTAFITSIASADSTLAGSAGVVDYAYRVSFINSTNIESPACAVKTFTITNTCSPVNVYFDAIPSSYGVNYLSVYRDDYLLETVTAGTSYVQDVHSTLTEARDTTIDDSRPPNINIFLYHDGYMFGAEALSTNLYYSEINDLEEWDSDNYIRVGDGDGMTIRGLAVYNNGLIIAKEDGYGVGAVYVLYMPDSDPDNWSLERLDVAYGSISPKVMCRFATFIIMLNRNGIYDLSNVNIGKVDSDAISYPIGPDIDDLITAYLSLAVAVTYKNKVWISVTASGTTNNRIYQYDFVRGRKEIGRGAWSKFTGLAIKDFAEHEGNLYGADYSGYVYKLNYSHNDNGSAIDSYFKTMHLHGRDEHKENTKVFRYIYVTAETSGDWYLTVEWKSDFATSVDGTTTLDLDPGGAVWGDAEWGIDVWGASRTQKMYKIPIHIVAKSIQVRFRTNGVGEYFKVYNMTIRYSLREAR
jgi:hypothetical protein